ncbi:MAG: hypothetical protein KBD53_04375 [Candidatus Omnitrophica bacterium]|nr:hypothetical protein [Candidatus Omnitrophota bacterium]
MNLKVFFKTISVITLLSLTYIHMQMQIFDLAYLGKDKQKMIYQLTQQKQNLTYEILKLKSANNLGDEMLGEKSEMQFMDVNNIVHISSTENLDEQQNTEGDQLSSVKKNPLANIVSFASRAEAKIQE